MLVDRLEALVNSGFRMPLTGKVSVDEREALDVLDLMRTAIPDEIKQARRVTQDREKILAQAQTESSRLVTQAQERAERLIADQNVHVSAEQRAQEVLARARGEAEEMRRGADDYAADMLNRLEIELNRIEASVRSAINALHNQPSSQPEDREAQ
jgi:cell division septum initiation protein DivIVA